VKFSEKRLFETFALLAVACILVCVIFFPYAPYRQIGDTFVDKMGRPVTATAYQLFQWWEYISILVWILFAFFAIRRGIDHYEGAGSLRPGTRPK
jgi:hypothetical protein